jgi:D-arabinose 1-dehydrogenase-like Zn-dependent alcohol dehydrogenase
LDGKVTQGGYSTAIRAPEQFVFSVPDALPLEDAAPEEDGEVAWNNRTSSQFSSGKAASKQAVRKHAPSPPTAIRAPEQFVFSVPDALPLEDAAPMACGGLTVYSPMKRGGVTKGTKLGVAGLGGLGACSSGTEKTNCSGALMAVE